ncbi:hypothetical protein [Paraburkholderia sp.]|uniref:hypothetical protein n=1 Tax=Paraburkholderia sp. TaxID=1926495 RepID=UPI003D6F0399
MKIDIPTGDLDICGTTIPSLLTLRAAMQGRSFQSAERSHLPGGYTKLVLEFRCDDCGYIVWTYFLGDRLSCVSIYLVDHAQEEGWSNWSEAAESASLDKLVKVLTQQGISNGQRFSWGDVSASYDPRAGVAGTTIRYLRRG